MYLYVCVYLLRYYINSMSYDSLRGVTTTTCTTIAVHLRTHSIAIITARVHAIETMT